MPKSLSSKQEYWAEHLQHAQSFGGTMVEYARAEGLSVKSLYRWRHYLNQSSENSADVPRPAFTRVVSTAVKYSDSLRLSTAKHAYVLVHYPNRRGWHS